MGSVLPGGYSTMTIRPCLAVGRAQPNWPLYLEVLADESHNCEPLASRSVRLGVRARNLCCGLSEPCFETGLAKSCVLTWHQRLIRDSRPRVKRVRVGDDLAGILERR